MPTTMRKIRSLQAEIIAMKQDILDKCLNKKIKCYVGVQLLPIYEQFFSRLKREYLKY